MSFFKQLYDNFEEGACALFVAVMVLCLFLQVAMRIAVGSSLAWTEELSRSVAYPRRCAGVGGMHYPVQLRAGELAHR